MKKTLAILTLVVMLAALIVPVAMAVVETRATCDHPGVQRVETAYRYTSNGSSGHTEKYGYVMRCTACSKEMGFEVITSTAKAHTLKQIDKGHDGTTVKHKYVTKCTKCGYSDNVTYRFNCPGGNGQSCIWPF